MSEIKTIQNNYSDFRKHLLATASAAVLLAAGYAASPAKADDQNADHPVLWIELGGQLDRLDDSQEGFLPPIMDGRPATLSSSTPYEKPPLYSNGAFAALSFQPDDSNWVFSGSVRFGRTQDNRRIHQQTQPAIITKYITYHPSGIVHKKTETPRVAKFADTSAKNSENYTITDFQAGKEIGIGLFGGANISSIIELGIRYAQFGSKTNVMLQSDPDGHPNIKYLTNRKTAHGNSFKFFLHEYYHLNQAAFTAARSFHGLGPSISWNASAPLAGNAQRGEVMFDWGVNAAVLFGRQKAKTHHQSSGQSGYLVFAAEHGYRALTAPASPMQSTRSRTVAVPNLGGFAGVSFRYSAAKINVGYRADLFWGAMDGGIDTRKAENIGFYGPFASVSIGIGG